jgi:branched-subunit amino acid aminotransferase/4-amino-4-deoxychorismate lyase
LLARHKTLNYWSKRLAYEQARSEGADEVRLATPDGRIWEASRSNLVLIQGDTLITPDLSGPVLPGVMRGLVLEHASAVGLAVREQGVLDADLDRADEIFLTNSVRGLSGVGRTAARNFAAPGPWTERLRRRIEDWLYGGSSRP